MCHISSKNMFMAYTPQAPTALSNGPTIIEAQVETIVDMIAKMETEKLQTIEPQKAAEAEWKATLDAMSKYTLIPYTDSWWNGANIPGKKAENMIYVSLCRRLLMIDRLLTFISGRRYQYVRSAVS